MSDFVYIFTPPPGGGGSHWLIVYGDAQRFKGAFSSLLVYRWVGPGDGTDLERGYGYVPRS